jgi:putative component of toxin-antitoxin plasmid stabilization module
MDRIKVAFIYKESNIFMTGKHFDNNYYNFFIKALSRNNKIDVTYFKEEEKFDISRLNNKFDIILLWQNNEFGTPDLVGIRDSKIPVITRCADPKEAEITKKYHKKWKIDYYFHFWPESFFHSILPKFFKYKSIIYGLEASLYKNTTPFEDRIKNKILNSGATGNTKPLSKIINDIRNPKWNAYRVYYLRTIINNLSYMEYFPTLNNKFVGDKFPLLLQKYQVAVAASTVTTVAKMWEIPAAGCMTFLEVNEKNNADFVGFKDNENAIFINEKNYKEKFQEYLENIEDSKWEKIAEKGKKFVMENLNNDKAVESLVELMQCAINEQN